MNSMETPVSRKILNVPRGTTEIMAGEFHGNSKSVCRKILNVPRGTTEIMAGEFHGLQVSIQENIECSMWNNRDNGR